MNHAYAQSTLVYLLTVAKENMQPITGQSVYILLTENYWQIVCETDVLLKCWGDAHSLC